MSLAHYIYDLPFLSRSIIKIYYYYHYYYYSYTNTIVGNADKIIKSNYQNQLLLHKIFCRYTRHIQFTLVGNENSNEKQIYKLLKIHLEYI